MRDWNVYMLLCSDGSLYTGSTNNVAKRLDQHNRGRAAKYTRSRLPVKLLYVKSELTKSDALKEEARIKGLSRLKKVELTDLWHSVHKEGDFCLSYPGRE